MAHPLSPDSPGSPEKLNLVKMDRRATMSTEASGETGQTSPCRSIFSFAPGGAKLPRPRQGIEKFNKAKADDFDTRTLAIDELVPEEQDALRPLDTSGDGMIRLQDLKQAAKMYGAAQELGVINVEAFPLHTQHELKAFDSDGDGKIDPQELAHAARLYRESQNTQARLVRSTVAMAVVSIILLGAMLGITLLAVDLMKETNTRSDGVMTVKDSDAPVQVQEQHINVPLGALPVLASNDPVRFLDQMKTVIIRVPEGGYRRTTVTDAQLSQRQLGSSAVGVVIYTTHGHTVTVRPDSNNVTTEAHVSLEGGRSFDVCAPCGEAGAVSMILTDVEKDLLHKYHTDAALKINRGQSRSCKLNPGTRAVSPEQGDDFSCADMAYDGVSDSFFGRGHFVDEDGHNIVVRFSVNGGSREMVYEYEESDGSGAIIGKRAVYFDDASFYYRGGRLIRCTDATPWTEGTNLRVGLVSEDNRFTVDEVHDGNMELTIPTKPTVGECEAIYVTNQAFIRAHGNTTVPTGANLRRAKILTAPNKILHKEAARMRLYSTMLAELDKSGQHRRAEALTAADNLANDCYYGCTLENGNACMLTDPQSSCTFAFRGSDDAHDWISNAQGVFHATSVNGRRMHGGFVAEFNAIRAEGFDALVAACPSPHFVGHSLGGAMATVARQYYGKGSVTTFGAPQVFDDNPGCSVPGSSRYFHEEDPVAGNLYGLMSSYWHGQDSHEIYWTCHSRHWWGGCRSSGYTTRGRDCQTNSGTWDTNFGAHSMTNYQNYY